MSRYLAGCILALAVLPAWAQPECAAPVLPDTEVGGWSSTDAGYPVAGRARYRLVSAATAGHGTATLGIFFSHKSGDRSRAGVVPSATELPGLMTANLQIRHEVRSSATPRGWDADEVEVWLDGKRFPGRLDVTGAADGMRPIVANWEVWYSDEDLFAAMEGAREMEVRMRDTATGSSVAFGFDISSFHGMRARVVPYWRCTAAAYRDPPH